MLKKLTALILCAALMCAVFTGCGHSSDISSGAGVKDYPVTIGNVTVREEPSGAAVLSANLADVILALGYEVQLKAKSADCTQSDLSVLPNVTADDADQIKSLGANLVLTDQALTDTQNAAMQKDGITVLPISPAVSRKDLEQLYIAVGSALKGAVTGYGRGEDVSEGILQTIDDITRVIPQSNTPVTAVYLYDDKGQAVTGDTIQSKLMEAAGLTNSASGGTGGSFSAADLLRADPQYIFCAKGVKDKLKTSAEYGKLSAVKAGKVYEMDPNLMLLQGEEMVSAVSFMAGTVHPELAGTVSGSSSASKPDTESGSSSSGTVSTDLNLNQTLKSGMQSDDVMKMQKRLEELGYMFVKPTGLFAEGTEQSVKDFQLLNGMSATGVADPATLKKLFSSDAKKRSPAN